MARPQFNFYACGSDVEFIATTVLDVFGPLVIATERSPTRPTPGPLADSPKMLAAAMERKDLHLAPAECAAELNWMYVETYWGHDNKWVLDTFHARCPIIEIAQSGLDASSSALPARLYLWADQHPAAKKDFNRCMRRLRRTATRMPPLYWIFPEAKSRAKYLGEVPKGQGNRRPNPFLEGE